MTQLYHDYYYFIQFIEETHPEILENLPFTHDEQTTDEEYFNHLLYFFREIILRNLIKPGCLDLLKIFIPRFEKEPSYRYVRDSLLVNAFRLDGQGADFNIVNYLYEYNAYTDLELEFQYLVEREETYPHDLALLDFLIEHHAHSNIEEHFPLIVSCYKNIDFMTKFFEYCVDPQYLKNIFQDSYLIKDWCTELNQHLLPEDAQEKITLLQQYGFDFSSENHFFLNHIISQGNISLAYQVISTLHYSIEDIYNLPETTQLGISFAQPLHLQYKEQLINMMTKKQLKEKMDKNLLIQNPSIKPKI